VEGGQNSEQQRAQILKYESTGSSHSLELETTSLLPFLQFSQVKQYFSFSFESTLSLVSILFS
jgi:hypothetical protein